MHPTAARRIPVALALALAAGAPVPAVQAAYWYDGFGGYPAGQSLAGQNQGTGWGGHWYTSGLTLAADAAGLSYAGLPDTPGAATTAAPTVDTAWSWNVRSLGRSVGQDDTTLFLSFLLRPAAGAPLSTYGGLNLGNLFIGKSGIDNGSNPLYGLEGPLNVITSSDLAASPGETVLFVLKASFLAGLDRFELFIDPLPGLIEPAHGAHDLTKTDFDLTTTDFIAVNNGGNWTIDEIRVGDSYGAVTVPLPGTPALLLGGLGVLATRRGVRVRG